MMPHNFILKYLNPKDTLVRNFFENYAVYKGEKVCLTTRKNKRMPGDNGIWVGTKEKYHKSLLKQFPTLTNCNLFNIKKWLFLPADTPNFEKTAIQLCKLIQSGDPRIGVTTSKNYSL
jgi:hypothetical protein